MDLNSNPYRPPVAVLQPEDLAAGLTASDPTRKAEVQESLSARDALRQAIRISFRYTIILMFNILGSYVFACALFDMMQHWHKGILPTIGGGLLFGTVSAIIFFLRAWTFQK